jgi:NAD(P)-dependent dehydrogenase (short-subunit alcohol dehydrogenase family)
LEHDGRVAIITGAGSGIGRAFAIGLAQRGAKVLVNDIAVETQVHESGVERPGTAAVVDEIRRAGGSAVAHAESVTSSRGPESIVQAALKAFGRIDVIVNNAGTAGSCAAFTALQPSDFRDQFELHTLGPALLAQAAWPHLAAAGQGRIINIVSGAIFGSPSTIPYTIAKAALFGLTRSLAVVGRGDGICANAVMVLAYTPMVQGSANEQRKGHASPEAGSAQEWFLRWLSETCPPQLVVPLIGWLAHPDCVITGELFSAGGGRVSRAIFADTPGIVEPRLSMETVRDRFDEVCKDDRFVRLQDMGERLQWTKSVITPDSSANPRSLIKPH